MGFVDAMGPTPIHVHVTGASSVAITFHFVEGLALAPAQGCVACCQQQDAFQLEITDSNGAQRLLNASATVTDADTITVVARQALTAGSSVVAVRYAVLDVPQCAIYNSAGLPANPFILPVETALEQTPVTVTPANSTVGKKSAPRLANRDSALQLPPMVR